MIEEIRTAPAEISFILPAFSPHWGWTRSTMPSIAQFIISKEMTSPIQIKRMHQSDEFTFKIAAVIIVSIAQMNMILMLRCFSAEPIPLKAYENDFKKDILYFFFGVKVN